MGRPHGLDGSFVVEAASDAPGRFGRGSVLYVDGDAARVVASKRARGRPVIRLDRPTTRGEELFVPRESLPPPEEGSYYVFELIGLEVLEVGGRALGRVTDVAEGVANDVLELDTGVALPFAETCIREIHLEAGTILIEPGFSEPD
ncbi:MAG: ribosome maturation factor RimM [Actinomycetota bacterium]|nr:ribosome maturation factor RimM [Actinomycetota bacterium]